MWQLSAARVNTAHSTLMIVIARPSVFFLSLWTALIKYMVGLIPHLDGFFRNFQSQSRQNWNGRIRLSGQKSFLARSPIWTKDSEFSMVRWVWLMSSRLIKSFVPSYAELWSESVPQLPAGGGGLMTIGIFIYSGPPFWSPHAVQKICIPYQPQ